MLWRRIPEEAIGDRAPSELRDLIPWFSDESFEVLRERGVLVGVEDTGVVIGALLRLGAGAEAARKFDEPPDWDDFWLIGTYRPDAVREIAEVFAGATLDAWVEEHAAALVEEAAKLGYDGGHRDAILESLLSDAKDVAALFTAAAAEREVVIHKVVV